MEIGTVLYEIRKEQNIKSVNLIKGICPASSYSDYENGKVTPDFLTVNRILERLGQEITSLSIWLSREEIEYLKWRTMICNAIEKKEYTKIKQLVEDKKVECSSFNKKLQTQFYLYVMGILEEKYYNNLSMALDYYHASFTLTASFLENKDWENKRVGGFEIGVYCLYLRLKINLEQKEGMSIYDKLEKLYAYIISMPDLEQKVKSLPLVVCVLEEVGEKINGLEKDDELQKSEDRLEEVYFLLKKCRYFYHINIIQKFLIKRKKYLNKEICKLKKEKESIEKLYTLFGKSVDYNPYNIYGNVWMLVSIGEYLERGRKKMGVTQEKISENICEPENYSRIESGKRKPKDRNYKALAKRIELEAKYYDEILSSNSAEAIKLRMKLSDEIFEGNYEKAEKILEKLNGILDKKNILNKQYLEEREALLRYVNKNVTIKQRIIDLQRILSYTIKTDDIGKKIHTYTKNEMNLINQLACAYYEIKQYEKASILLEGYISDVIGEVWNENQRFRESYIEFLNLEKCYANLLRFKEANEICVLWIQKALDIGYAASIDEYLVEYSYNLECLNKNNSDKPMQICQLALELSKVYGNNRRRDLIFDYYTKIYGN